jgi:hypothetical protein
MAAGPSGRTRRHSGARPRWQMTAQTHLAYRLYGSQCRRRSLEGCSCGQGACCKLLRANGWPRGAANNAGRLPAGSGAALSALLQRSWARECRQNHPVSYRYATDKFNACK